jgi:hypothetical protein
MKIQSRSLTDLQGTLTKPTILKQVQSEILPPNKKACLKITNLTLKCVQLLFQGKKQHRAIK